MAKNRFFDIFTSFSLEHGPFFSTWWPSEENAKKSFFDDEYKLEDWDEDDEDKLEDNDGCHS